MRAAALLLAALLVSAVFAGAASARAPAPDASSQGTLATSALIPDLFAGADPSHNAGEAQRVRALASALSTQIAQLPDSGPTVGVATFALEQKLPYKKMLIATGVLIGLVLAIMVGTTIHNLQGLGWIPTSATSFQLDLAWRRWLGLYANWEGIGGQLAALAVVYGSYALARGLQKHRRQRAISRSARRAEPQSVSEH